MAKKPAVVVFQVGRRADNGRLTTVEWAKAHPTIAVVETMKRPQ